MYLRVSLSFVVQHAQLAHLTLEVALQLVGTLVVFGFGRIVDPTIGENARHVGDEKSLRHVISDKIWI